MIQSHSLGQGLWALGLELPLITQGRGQQGCQTLLLAPAPPGGAWSSLFPQRQMPNLSPQVGTQPLPRLSVALPSAVLTAQPGPKLVHSPRGHPEWPLTLSLCCVPTGVPGSRGPLGVL